MEHCIWICFHREPGYFPNDFTVIFIGVALRLITRLSYAHWVWSGTSGTVSAAIAGVPSQPTLGSLAWIITAVIFDTIRSCLTSIVSSRSMAYPPLWMRWAAWIHQLEWQCGMYQARTYSWSMLNDLSPALNEGSVGSSIGCEALTSALGGKSKWGKPHSQESLVHITHTGEGTWDMHAPKHVWVLVCIRGSGAF